MIWFLLIFMIALSGVGIFGGVQFALRARFGHIRRLTRGAIRLDLLGSLICFAFAGMFGWVAVEIAYHMLNI